MNFDLKVRLCNKSSGGVEMQAKRLLIKQQVMGKYACLMYHAQANIISYINLNVYLEK